MASLLPLCAALATATSSAAPTIELVTMGAGEPLYARWGHAAIRVVERAPRRDIAYNFGSIDVSGAFVARMLSGRVDAFVAAVPYHRMAPVYRAEDRDIVRRTLNLTDAEARAVAATLAAQDTGPGSTYPYHHFDDNCSTRVADILDRALGGAWRDAAQAPAKVSLRKLALDPLRPRTFLYVLTDIGLSGAVDRPVTRWDLRFHPARFAALLDDLERPDGRPWVRSSIVEHRGAPFRPEAWTWPWTKVYILFVLPLLGLGVRFRRTAGVVWTGLAGGLGLLLTLAWGLTQYDFLHANWNLLCFPPTHLIAAVALVRGPPKPALRVYAFAHVVALFGLAGASAAGLVTQAVGPALGLALGPAVLLAWAQPTARRTPRPAPG